MCRAGGGGGGEGGGGGREREDGHKTNGIQWAQMGLINTSKRVRMTMFTSCCFTAMPSHTKHQAMRLAAEFSPRCLCNSIHPKNS